jgi:DNA replication protein DnaC
MNPMPELSPLLKQLRLSGIMATLEQRNREAIKDKLSFTEFLALLIQDEVARRDQKKYELRFRRASFRGEKTLENFDFAFNPKINQALVLDLATGRFIDEKACVLIAGPCGTGKSHLAQALGRAAVQRGFDVIFTTQSQLAAQLHAARATDSYERRFSYYAKVPLLIIDDFGLKPLRTRPDGGTIRERLDDRHEQPRLLGVGRRVPEPALGRSNAGPTPARGSPDHARRQELPRGETAHGRRKEERGCQH